MKRRSFLVLAIAINIALIFLQIYKYHCWIYQQYKRQEQECIIVQQQKKKANLIQELCALQDPRNIKEYAIKKLGMQKVRLAQIKRLSA